MAPLVVTERSGLPPASGLSAVDGQPERGQLRHEDRQVRPDRGLAAGEAEAVDVEALDEDPSQPLELLERQQVLARAATRIPSAGMQYVQRKLQRSVTEMRRSRMVRRTGRRGRADQPRASSPA